MKRRSGSPISRSPPWMNANQGQSDGIVLGKIQGNHVNYPAKEPCNSRPHTPYLFIVQTEWRISCKKLVLAPQNRSIKSTDRNIDLNDLDSTLPSCWRGKLWAIIIVFHQRIKESDTFPSFQHSLEPFFFYNPVVATRIHTQFHTSSIRSDKAKRIKEVSLGRVNQKIPDLLPA